MKMRDDGSVQPGSLPTYGNVARPEDNAIYRCMVSKVIFVDDARNITANSPNPRVTYECIVLGGFASGQVLSNCRLSSDLGGNFNFYERVLKAASKDISKTKLSDNDGDIVFVQFVQGHTGYPVITALDNGISTQGSIGATSSDGPVVKWQYNGINVNVDKNGNLTLTRKGGTYDADSKTFTPASNGKKIQVKLSNQVVAINTESGLAVTLDGDADKALIQTKGGAKAEIDGKAGSVKLKDNGTGALTLKGSKVALGASSAELLDQISQALDAAITVATSEATHTHLGNLGFPTGPTDQAGAWSSFKSALQGIKGLVDGIKGTL